MQTAMLKPRIVEVEQLGASHARVVMEPFERGYGHTLGNALRRVLLSSMVGYAPTEVQITGVVHEYSTIDGVREDVVDLLLNLKGVTFRLHNRDEVFLTLRKDTPGPVTAADIDVPHDVEVINPEHVIATLTQGGKLDMSIKVERGRGYLPGTMRNLGETKTIGKIVLDASFSPVRRVSYQVESARVEQRTDLDRLVVDVETNGVIAPEEAVLAQFHELAAAYQAPCEERVPQFGHYPIAVEQHPRFDHPEAFAAVIAFVRDSYATPSQVPAVERATEWVRWLGQAYSDEVYAKLPKSVIHGDFNGCNLLFASDGRVVGVFDYDWAWRDTRVRDVGEALFFFGACRDEAPDTGSIWSLTACPRFDTARMADFLHSYRQASPLSDDELAATPLAMLGRWVACRTEGAMKVPERRRAEFLLADFEVPFRWYQAEAEKLLNLANR